MSWFRSGASSFAALTGKVRFMNFVGHSEAARAYQTLRKVDDIAQFSKNATGYVGSFGSALVPYGTDVAANSTLLYRDVRTW
ncbi:hypothetical protein [Promicromonospora sp. NPDC023987]|uniref:hypothetical protein n=1 Tax=Promicromonospora sp. NPDC023987 TaxID=3155360 RepID=UPI0033CE847E